MARNMGTVVNNSFARGLITEATGLNFPENAATDALNVKFDSMGFVERRKGLDVEGGATTLTPREDDGVINEFIWQAVARTGGFTFLVLQTGSVVHFYELTTSDALSSGIQPVSLDLNNFKAPQGGVLHMTPCSFSAGAGYMFIAHPFCDPIIVRWMEDEQIFEASRISILIRDFEGVEDTEGILTNPVNLTDQHHYNLRNQGWNQDVRVGSTSNEVGEGGPLSMWGPPGLNWQPIA